MRDQKMNELHVARSVTFSALERALSVLHLRSSFEGASQQPIRAQAPVDPRRDRPRAPLDLSRCDVRELRKQTLGRLPLLNAQSPMANQKQTGFESGRWSR